MLAEAEYQTNKVTNVTKKLCSEILLDDKDNKIIFDKLECVAKKFRKKINRLVSDSNA